MNPELPLLNQIDVASPCHVSWDEMSGDERVRFCGHCRLNVYNLSEMSRKDAEDLVRSNEGRLCVRFFRRHDGTVLTRDCPVGIRALRRRLLRAVAGVAGMVIALVSGTAMARYFPGQLATLTSAPGSLDRWVEPQAYILMGVVCPPPPGAPPTPGPSGQPLPPATEGNQAG